MSDNGVLITKGKAGLGNRLLAVLGSLMYCDLTGRSLYVDWSDGNYAEDRLNAWDYAFALKSRQAEVEPADGQDIYPPLWRENLSQSVEEMIGRFDPEMWNQEMAVYDRYSVRMEDLERPEKTLVRWSYFDDFASIYRRLGHRWFSQRLRIRVLRKLMRQYIELTPAIREELVALERAILAPQTIGVHIRYTDNKGPYQKLVDKVATLAERNPEAKIYLATDNKKVTQDLAEVFPDRLLINDKMMPDDGRPLHHVLKSRQALKEVLIDMYLLSRCQWLVFSSVSSLGLCAALLSQAPESHIFDRLSNKVRLRNLAKTLYINLKSLAGS